LLNKEDLTLDQASTREEQWAYYVDSYYMHADTEGVATDMLTAPWLRRSVFPSEAPQEAAVVLNELQVKICLNTYKLFYLVNTEDTLVRRKVNRVVDTKKWESNRTARLAEGKKWTQDGYHTKEEQNAAAAAAEAREQHMAQHSSTLSTVVSQTSPPPASSATPVPQPDLQRSADPTPNPPIVEDTAGMADDVKVESPPVPVESGEAMDIESAEQATSVVPEQTQEEPKAVDEDVEMTDA
jgi:C-terminal domain of Sin3a protein